MKTQKLIYLILLSMLLALSACAPASPATEVALATEAPATLAGNPTVQPATPTVTLPGSTPVSQADCTEGASFVADVTIPDNALVNAGTQFVKTWRFRNTGSCTWDARYSMVFVDGEKMKSPDSLPFPPTAPGSTMDITVTLESPTTNGSYTGNYELHDPAGKVILVDNTQLVWVKITVGSGTTQATIVPGTTPVTVGSCTYTENPTLLSDLVSAVNKARAANGLPALKLNGLLSSAAMVHSIDMACNNFVSHTGSNGSSITSRIAATGYSYNKWNEATYVGKPQFGANAQAAVDWWLNDPPHRAIILSPDYTEIGVGFAYVEASDWGGYFTIDVASPK